MKKYLPIVLIIAVFIFSSFLSQEYSGFLKEYISQYQVAGLFIYTATVILAIVVAPLTSIPFIPILVESWGVFWTATTSIIGWTIGSIIAFWVARKFGAPVAKKFVTINDKKKQFYQHTPREHLFWYLIFLRIIVPVDILSYMLGLFTNIGWKIYIVTTFLGVIPAVLVFSFFGTFPIEYQVVLFIAGIILFGVFLLIKNKLRR